jgi:hypothetical protein
MSSSPTRPRPSLRPDDELDRFKRDINLTELAASYGYRLVGRQGASGASTSAPASIAMRHPGTDDKVIIRRDRDGHWTYFSVRDDRDNGTVVDFLQRRHARGLGDVRRELRAWLHEDRPRVPVALFRADVKTQSGDVASVAAVYLRGRAGRSRYLAQRGIASSVALDTRFASSYRVDSRGNVLFPHTDPATHQVVGFEIKNKGFTSFSPGGRKTYWLSEARPDDDRLVIVEGSIDAFSYHQLFPHSRARYMSTGGAVGRDQLDLIARAVAAMPAHAQIVSATDNDLGGERLHGQLVDACARPLRRHFSPVPKDWNDCLRSLDRSRSQGPSRRMDR